MTNQLRGILSERSDIFEDIQIYSDMWAFIRKIKIRVRLEGISHEEFRMFCENCEFVASVEFKAPTMSFTKSGIVQTSGGPMVSYRPQEVYTAEVVLAIPNEDPISGPGLGAHILSGIIDGLIELKDNPKDNRSLDVGEESIRILDDLIDL